MIRRAALHSMAESHNIAVQRSKLRGLENCRTDNRLLKSINQWIVIQQSIFLPIFVVVRIMRKIEDHRKPSIPPDMDMDGVNADKVDSSP
jgi:hypothetical protein